MGILLGRSGWQGSGQQGALWREPRLALLAPGGLSPPPAASGAALARRRRPSHGPQSLSAAAESGRGGGGGGGRGGLHRQHGLQQALALRRPHRAHAGVETRASGGLPARSPRPPPRLWQPSTAGGAAVPTATTSPGPGGRVSPFASLLSPGP